MRINPYGIQLIPCIQVTTQIYKPQHLFKGGVYGYSLIYYYLRVRGQYKDYWYSKLFAPTYSKMLTLYVIESSLKYYSGHLYGLEKFWAFLKYYKGHQPLDISPELTKRLSKFKTLEDFRVAAAADVRYLNRSSDNYNTDCNHRYPLIQRSIQN